MNGSTTEKPLTDWNAWLGEVPPEKRHVGETCAACVPSGYTPGSVQRARCGVYFVARGGHAGPGPQPGYCDDCARLWSAPCASPACPRNRKP